MSKEKYKKNELESDYKQDQQVEQKIQPLDRPTMTFDLYFQKLLSKNSKIYAHHKAPMRRFAENKGLVEGTEEEFDEVFRKY